MSGRPSIETEAFLVVGWMVGRPFFTGDWGVGCRMVALQLRCAWYCVSAAHMGWRWRVNFVACPGPHELEVVSCFVVAQTRTCYAVFAVHGV